MQFDWDTDEVVVSLCYFSNRNPAKMYCIYSVLPENIHLLSSLKNGAGKDWYALDCQA